MISLKVSYGSKTNENLKIHFFLSENATGVFKCQIIKSYVYSSFQDKVWQASQIYSFRKIFRINQFYFTLSGISKKCYEKPYKNSYTSKCIKKVLKFTLNKAHASFK